MFAVNVVDCRLVMLSLLKSRHNLPSKCHRTSLSSYHCSTRIGLFVHFFKIIFTCLVIESHTVAAVQNNLYEVNLNVNEIDFLVSIDMFGC